MFLYFNNYIPLTFPQLFVFLYKTVPDHAKQIFQRLLHKRPNPKFPFPPALKSFASTLHFYSPKAYNYVRESFFKCLPHPLTIQQWSRNIKCSAGIALRNFLKNLIYD